MVEAVPAICGGIGAIVGALGGLVIANRYVGDGGFKACCLILPGGFFGGGAAGFGAGYLTGLVLAGQAQGPLESIVDQ